MPARSALSSATASRWRAAISANGCGAAASCSSGTRRRPVAQRTQLRRRARCSVKRRADRSGAGRTAPRGAELRQLAAKCRERMRKPVGAGLRPRPAQHRALQRSIAAACAPVRVQPQQRMLEQRQQRHRREPAERRLGDQPREHAGRRVGQRVAAGIVDRHVPARQRRQHAPRQRAVGRDQRGGLARRLDRLAQRDRDRERLLLGVGGLDHRDATPAHASHAPQSPARRERCCQMSVAAAGRSASETRRSRPCGAGGRARRPPRARCRCAAAVPAWRIADGRPRRDAAGSRGRRGPDQLPGRVVEVGVEAGQHHGAVRQAWRWSRSASRSPASSRSSRPRSPARRAGGEPRRLGGDQQVAPRGRLDRVPFRRGSLGHCSRAILRKSSVICQYSSSSSGTRSSSRSQRHLARRHVVHQAREIVGQRQRGGRAVGDQRRLPARRRACRRPPISGPARPSSMLRSSPPSASGRSSALPVRSLVAASANSDLVLVDVADRHDARQDRGIAPRRLRGTRRAPAGRRGASAGRSSRAASASGSRQARKPGPSRPPSTRRSASAGTAPRPEW